MVKIATSDIESNNWIEFLMIGFYDGSRYKIFKSIDEYLDFIIDKKYNGYRIYFHNGGKFDFLFLVEKLLDRGTVKFINKSNGILGMLFTAKRNKAHFTFMDSFALLPASLDKLIETFEIEHKKIPIDFSIKRKYSDLNLQQHLKNDCKALYDVLIKFQDEEGFMSYTIASHALNVFKKKFFSGYIWNVNEKFDFYFRENYYKGGRVEVYKAYGKNLYYYDVNSLYPSVMLEKMPVGSPKKTKTFKKGKIGFYKIKLKQSTNFHISILSIKTKSGNFYVNGNAGDIFYLISCELEELIKEKIKFEIVSGYYFEKSEFIFNDYVKHYYKIKENETGVKRYLAKLMLNSLYGKFGQKLSGPNIEMNDGSAEHIIFDAYNDLVLVDRVRHIKYKGVYISAYITALARMKHYQLMKDIGFKNIFYCDTDSIITNKKIKIGTKIGELKLEAIIKEGIFLLPKTYGFIDDKNKSKVHFKGFKTNSFSFKELKELLLGKKNELIKHEMRMLGFKESQKRINNIKQTESTYLKLAEFDKKLSFNYIRRKKIPSKKYVFEFECFNKTDVTN